MDNIKEKKERSFDEVMKLIQHIGDEERHFNSLELEYRKLTSQWLLVSIAAMGFIFTQQKNLPFNAWIIVAALCAASSIGIFVLWMMDVKVYHELLHSVFRHGVMLEMKHDNLLPPMRIEMVESQTGGDILKRVKYFYFYSILVLLTILNISLHFLLQNTLYAVAINIGFVVLLFFLHRIMNSNTDRELVDKVKEYRRSQQAAEKI